MTRELRKKLTLYLNIATLILFDNFLFIFTLSYPYLIYFKIR